MVGCKILKLESLIQLINRFKKKKLTEFEGIQACQEIENLWMFKGIKVYFGEKCYWSSHPRH